MKINNLLKLFILCSAIVLPTMASERVVNPESPISNSKFVGLSGEQNGGAIYNGNGSTLVVENSTFTNNSASQLILNEEGKWVETGSDGGAIYNEKGATLTILNSIFEGNRAKNGGAIYNAGELILGDNIKFIDNYAGYDGYYHGSDIFNATNGKVTIGDNFSISRTDNYEAEAIFIDHDCAIFSEGNGTITIGNNASFTGINEPIVIASTDLTIGDNVHFDNISSGAIKIYGSAPAVIGKNAVFENGIGRAIALFNPGIDVTIGDNLVVKNNTNVIGYDANYGIFYIDPESSIEFLGTTEFSNNSTPFNHAGVFQN